MVKLPPPFTNLAGFVYRGKLAEAQDGKLAHVQDGKLWHRHKVENFGTGTRWKIKFTCLVQRTTILKLKVIRLKWFSSQIRI